MKVALVTGANRGIGKEIARQLAEKTFTVLLTARDYQKAEVAAQEIDGDVVPLKLDVRSDEDSVAATKYIQEHYKSLDVLVNNAGVISSVRAVNASVNDLMKVLDTNYFGMVRVTHALLPLLRNSSDARIINISSGMGALADLEAGGYAPYRLSKANLNAYTILLAAELRATSVKVNAVCPGWVKTDMGGAGALRSVSKGAETPVWLATEKNISTGKFFRDKHEIEW